MVAKHPVLTHIPAHTYKITLRPALSRLIANWTRPPFCGTFVSYLHIPFRLLLFFPGKCSRLLHLGPLTPLPYRATRVSRKVPWKLFFFCHIPGNPGHFFAPAPLRFFLILPLLFTFHGKARTYVVAFPPELRKNRLLVCVRLCACVWLVVYVRVS